MVEAMTIKIEYVRMVDTKRTYLIIRDDNEGLVEVMTGDEAIKYAEKIGEFMNDIISERDKA